jgi:hypothetical protein
MALPFQLAKGGCAQAKDSAKAVLSNIGWSTPLDFSGQLPMAAVPLSPRGIAAVRH